ncbi:MAG: TRAP transporter small permease [Rhodobacteraceae bacterium]|nr:TRAP transporter small permease [Paracoccaceae bacterium]
MLHRFSALWAKMEMALAAVLAAGVTLMILYNVTTRSMGNAIYWVDETAIYIMVWMAFLAASAAVQKRDSIAVTLVSDALSGRRAQALRLGVDLVILGFAVAMAWLVWIWFDLPNLAEAGFERRAFQRLTFNFIYSEPTLTLGWPKWVVWLIMPIFAFGLLLHSLSNTLLSIRALRRPLPEEAAR